MPTDHERLTDLLARGGFLSASDEATLLIDAAAGDAERLDALLQRRLSGEPLAWITGTTVFCGAHVRVAPGVYVPRPQTEELVQYAIEALPETGTAVDVCTGSGAIAVALKCARPRATVLACDISPAAVDCALRNGITAYRGDLLAALPGEARHDIDVIVAVVPYVPTPEMEYLQRDTLNFEAPLAYDGGDDGTAVLRRLIHDGAPMLRPGGRMYLELGGEQDDLIAADCEASGLTITGVIVDDDGDIRGVDLQRG